MDSMDRCANHSSPFIQSINFKNSWRHLLLGCKLMDCHHPVIHMFRLKNQSVVYISGNRADLLLQFGRILYEKRHEGRSNSNCTAPIDLGLLDKPYTDQSFLEGCAALVYFDPGVKWWTFPLKYSLNEGFPTVGSRWVGRDRHPKPNQDLKLFQEQVTKTGM